MIDGNAYLPVTTNPSYVTATMPDDGSSVFPTALVIDEASGVNWEGGAQSFVDGLAADYSDMQVTLADGETPVPFGVEDFSQVSGSRQLVVHLGIPSLSSSVGTELLLWRGVEGGPFEDKNAIYLGSDGWRIYCPFNDSGTDVAQWGDSSIWYKKDTAAGTVTRLQSLLGYGFEFAGGHVEYQDGRFELINTATVGVWFYPYSVANDMTIYWHHYYNDALTIRNGNLALNNVWGQWMTLGPVTANIWTFAGTYGVPPSASLYAWDAVNGWRVTSKGYESRARGTAATIGKAAWGAGDFNGLIDGYRYSDRNKSLNWLQTTAQLEFYNDAFWTVGEETGAAAKRYPAARRPQIYKMGPRMFVGGA